MTTNTRAVHTATVIRAIRAATQWRLLLLWALLLSLPTAIVALPLWRSLAAILDHSIHAQAWADHFSAVMFGDTMGVLTQGSFAWFGATFLLGLLLTLLLSPFLNGMLVGSGRAARTLGFGELLQCGIYEYGRMFRVMLWSILPYLVVIAAAGAGFHWADKVGDHAVLESKADMASHAVFWLLGILWIVAQTVVESTRGAFIADTRLRSATRAFGRAWVQLLRRPGSSLIYYVLISLVGYAAAFGFGLARVHIPAVGTLGWLLAMLMTQLVVIAVAWAHVARVFALAEVARSMSPPSVPPAL
ncbi:MAG: hypothetical protein ABI114_03245 [Rhodanobacter sp.]